MKKKIRNVAAYCVLIFGGSYVVYFSALTFSIVFADMDEIIDHSVGEGYILYPNWLAELYLFKLRSDEKDIASSVDGWDIERLIGRYENNPEKTMKYLSFFIEKGFDINTPDKFGETALHYAIEYNHPKLVTYLIGIGADNTTKTKFKRLNAKFEYEEYAERDALEYAKYRSSWDKLDRGEIIRLLADRTEDVN